MLRIFEGSGTVLDSEYQASVARRNTELERRLQALERRPAIGNDTGAASDTGSAVAQSEYQAALEQVTRLQEQLQELASRLAALEGQ
jgi:transcription elongation GreA/GreB family factor